MAFHVTLSPSTHLFPMRFSGFITHHATSTFALEKGAKLCHYTAARGLYQLHINIGGSDTGCVTNGCEWGSEHCQNVGDLRSILCLNASCVDTECYCSANMQLSLHRLYRQSVLSILVILMIWHGIFSCTTLIACIFQL